MGTSTGYMLPTSGNWPDVKRDVTSLGRSGVSDESGMRRLMSDYVQAHGGYQRATQQMPAARLTGARLGGFLAGVRQSGLTQSLVEAGLDQLVGQSAPKVMLGLADYLVGQGSLLEEDIVRWAIFDYLDETFGNASYEELEIAFSRLLQRESIGAILRQVFGLCIYRRFRTHFFERLLKATANTRTARQVFRDIKGFILGKLGLRTFGRDLAQIDWRGPDGERLSNEILASTWRVFGEG